MNIKQEWTPEYVQILVARNIFTDAKVIADAHNAALAAERANRETVEKLMIEMANAVDRRIKPLVDALEWIATGEFDDLEPDDGLHRTSARRTAIDALAKMKEDKCV